MSMDETTQQNAALVEETTSAAQSMKEQAKELLRQVDTFKVGGADSAASVKSSLMASRSAVATLPKAAPKKMAAGKTVARPEPVVASGSKPQHGGDEFEEF
jgi:methyl-accepting chemotaxis protein